MKIEYNREQHNALYTVFKAKNKEIIPASIDKGLPRLLGIVFLSAWMTIIGIPIRYSHSFGLTLPLNVVLWIDVIIISLYIFYMLATKRYFHQLLIAIEEKQYSIDRRACQEKHARYVDHSDKISDDRGYRGSGRNGCLPLSLLLLFSVALPVWIAEFIVLEGSSQELYTDDYASILEFDECDVITFYRNDKVIKPVYNPFARNNNRQKGFYSVIIKAIK